MKKALEIFKTGDNHKKADDQLKLKSKIENCLKIIRKKDQKLDGHEKITNQNYKSANEDLLIIFSKNGIKSTIDEAI